MGSLQQYLQPGDGETDYSIKMSYTSEAASEDSLSACNQLPRAFCSKKTSHNPRA